VFNEYFVFISPLTAIGAASVADEGKLEEVNFIERLNC
jgi:hypothetical protein